MDTHELLGRITRLPIVADGLAEEMLSGNFRSVFKGQGMEFDEARHYQWGDDARTIDWNASARLGTPFIKMYREERELTILLLLDASDSMRCGTSRIWDNDNSLTPYEQALISAALISFSAERSGQRVGAFLFDREIERVFPPRKGRRNILAIVSGALQYHNKGLGTGDWGSGIRERESGSGISSDVKSAIIGASRMLKRRSMVVIISDFFNIGWEHELTDLCRMHDVIAIRVSDPRDRNFPDLGLLTIVDPETGLKTAAPTGSGSFQNAWSEWQKERADLWTNLCRRAGASQLELPVDADAAAALTRFFSGRRR